LVETSKTGTEVIRIQIPCQYLYSNENADYICISQQLGASADHSFIAEMFTFGRDDGTTTYGHKKGEAVSGSGLYVCKLNSVIS
jgi:hypothetical protein